MGSNAQKQPIAFPLLLFTIKKEEVSILLLDLGPLGPTQGGPKGPAQLAQARSRKGPSDGPRAVSALPNATAGCINSGPCNRRPQSISGVDGEPRNADRLSPKSAQSQPKVGPKSAQVNPKSRSKGQLFDIRPSGKNSGWRGWLRREKVVW